VLMPGEDLFTSVGGSIWSHIPNTQRVIYGITEQMCAVWIQREACNAVCMPSEAHRLLPFSQIPDSDVVVQASRVDLPGRCVSRMVVSEGRTSLQVSSPDAGMPGL